MRLGADAVSVHINVGSEHEQHMLDQFSRILDECDNYGLPTLAMMYPRGPKIPNELAPEVVAHATRLGYEIGADVVKTNYTGNIETFREIVNSVKVPVIVAGGPKTQNGNDTLQIVHDSIKAGSCLKPGRRGSSGKDSAAQGTSVSVACCIRITCHISTVGCNGLCAVFSALRCLRWLTPPTLCLRMRP